MIKCPACGKTQVKLLYPAAHKRKISPDKLFDCTSPSYGNHGAVYQCRECEFIFIADQTKSSEIIKHYSEVNDPLYLEEEAARIKTFSRHLKNMAEFKKGKLLDVGAYTGLFVYLARKQGWQAQGLEPSNWAVTEGEKKYKVKLTQGILHLGQFPAQSFDMVTMWDVVEHFTDPKTALKTCYGFLKPGGWLAMTTIDIGSLLAQVMGANWPWLMQMHRVYFSQNSMQRMLEEVGFTYVYFKPHIRYIGLGYVWNRFLPAILPKAWQKKIVPFYLGDLFDVYAQKPEVSAV